MFVIKKILIVVILIVTICFSGCSKNENTVPEYFLEPEGYIIATIQYGQRTLFGYSVAYGYILETDYSDFTDNREKEFLKLLHPYDENKSVDVKSSEIASISIGTYEYYR